MTDETVLGGNSEQPSGGTGTPSSSPSGSGSQLSPDVAALQKRIDELEKLYKGVQKGNDKTNAKVLEKVDSLSSQIGRIYDLAKAGKSQSEIEERLLLDEILAERRGNTAPTSPEGTGGGGQGQVDVQDIAKQLNLDVNDKDIATAVASGNLANVMRVAMSKAQAPSPGPEDAAPLGGGERRPDKGTEIEQGYLAEMAKVPRGNIRMAANVKEKWRKKAREAGLQLNV